MYHVGRDSILNERTVVLFRGSVLPVCHIAGVARQVSSVNCNLGGNVGKNHVFIQHVNCRFTSIYQQGKCLVIIISQTTVQTVIFDKCIKNEIFFYFVTLFLFVQQQVSFSQLRVFFFTKMFKNTTLGQPHMHVKYLNISFLKVTCMSHASGMCTPLCGQP